MRLVEGTAKTNAAPRQPRSSMRRPITYPAITMFVAVPVNLALVVMFGSEFPFLETLLLILVNSLLLAAPISVGYRYYRYVEQRLTSLIVVLCAVFAIFFPLGALPVLSLAETTNVSNLLLGIPKVDLWQAAMTAELVLLASWVVMMVVLKNLTPLDQPELTQQDDGTERRLTGVAAALIGSSAIILALLAYLSLIPSLGAYVESLAQIASRGATIMPDTGSSRIVLLQSFLTPGVLLLGFGLRESELIGTWRALFTFILLALLVAILMLPFGGRGAMLQPFVLAVIVYERRVGVLPQRLRLFFALLTLLVVFGVLYLRFAQRDYGVQEIQLDSEVMRAVGENILTGDVNRFLSVTYLTDEVAQNGSLRGRTLLTGWINLLPNRFIGGERAWRSEDEVMIRKWGISNPNHAMMLSIPGDLYFNLGLLGMIVGMALMGVVIGVFRNWLRASRTLPRSVVGAWLILTLSTGLTINLAMWPAVVLYGIVPYLATWGATALLARSLPLRRARPSAGYPLPPFAKR